MNVLDAIQRARAQTAAVYGRQPRPGVSLAAPRVAAAIRRRNPRLWTAADRERWQRLSPAQQRHEETCAIWQKYGEHLAGESVRAREAALANFKGARLVILRARAERELAEAIRLHRPVRRLRDSLRYRWYLDPAAERQA